MFKRIAAALERIADALEILSVGYEDQRMEQKRYMEDVLKKQESIPSIMDIFSQVKGALETTPDQRRQINGH